MTTSTPKHGQTVVFSKVPAGSYCSTGVAYRVDRKDNKGAFRFENVERGSATYDQPWAVKSAQWEIAA
ncbi:hypothetical protein PMI01_02208 [Caulobacter sp. AP07]|uniref:hypothetical protein n=1 Tax=Caulobacter sp. AP07 TaxID=1144304 RepID=UPI000272202F|nr:hypothetical protein [Caulobacter sp. AP07]EJL33246.1 hypothetical protein PMI01_02208 [Caulobacter sp. AP07]